MVMTKVINEMKNKKIEKKIEKIKDALLLEIEK